MEDHKGPDRRKYFRVALPLLVSYTVVDVPQEIKELYAKDISGSGMRIPLIDNLAVGTLLKVELDLLKEERKIQLDAKVIWVSPVPDDRQYPYEAGIEFINVDLADRIMISNCVLYRAELLKGPYL
jgi:c-di-GMP-binding flagellar brake protein YcgR